MTLLTGRKGAGLLLPEGRTCDIIFMSLYFTLKSAVIGKENNVYIEICSAWNLTK